MTMNRSTDEVRIVSLVDITLDTGGYTAGDSVGNLGHNAVVNGMAGIRLEGTERMGGEAYYWDSIQVIEKGAQKPSLAIYLSDKKFGGGTYTDSAAVSFSEDDLLHLYGPIEIDASDYHVTNAAITSVNDCKTIVKVERGSCLYAYIVAMGDYTPAGANDLKLKFGFFRPRSR